MQPSDECAAGNARGRCHAAKGNGYRCETGFTASAGAAQQISWCKRSFPYAYDCGSQLPSIEMPWKAPCQTPDTLYEFEVVSC